MEITVKTVEHVTVFEIVGDIDGKTAPQVLENVKAEAPSGGKVLLDMSQVPYMSSAGLRVLLSIYRYVSGGHGSLVLTGLNEEIKDTMDMTGFLSQFTTCDTVAEGIQALSD
ncbi:anti-sigma factor antagonist [Candidatus Vecturithrix granuli]|uniref:Anti-sigma factor antagonist n=1 Tax=Vecturithrix granuli TaxID=1499967 RepID=A0A0S6WAC0_VECG1|nr:anti-sigma factor antagonist [Candidatus Vecturithrix granuli]